MDKYINEYNVIIDCLVKHLNEEKIHPKIKNALNEEEILELQNKIYKNTKKEILSLIGYSTYDIIDKNIHIDNNYVHPGSAQKNIYQICSPIQYGASTAWDAENSFYQRTKYNEIIGPDDKKYRNVFEYFYKNYISRDSRRLNKTYYIWTSIYKYILSLNDLEHDLFYALRDEKNNYFSIIPKDITECVYQYLKFDAFCDYTDDDYNNIGYNAQGSTYNYRGYDKNIENDDENSYSDDESDNYDTYDTD